MTNKEINTCDVPDKLKDLRRSRGLTVQEFAREVGENHQKVGRIERGKTHPTLDYLLKISNTLDIPLDNLLSDEKEKSTPTKKASSENNLDEMSLLNQVVIFVEENTSLIQNCSPQRKGQLVCKLYECLMHVPKNAQDQFLNSLSNVFALFTDAL
jgi:transcriptional regulator with XRE-family HTH domain